MLNKNLQHLRNLKGYTLVEIAAYINRILDVDVDSRFYQTKDKIFYTLPIEKRNRFIDYLFGGVLYYSPNSFRTPFSSFLIENKIQHLQALQLLKIEKPSINLLGSPILGGSRVENRTILQTVFDLFNILAA